MEKIVLVVFATIPIRYIFPFILSPRSSRINDNPSYMTKIYEITIQIASDAITLHLLGNTHLDVLKYYRK